jgi:hypothetical protein
MSVEMKNEPATKHLKIVGCGMDDRREQAIGDVASVPSEASRRLDDELDRQCDRERDVYQATAALKAISGLCTTCSRAAQDETLDCVGRHDMAALLDLISDRLERSMSPAR